MNPPTEIYYWPRRFLMRSRDFLQSRPYRRITTTLIAAPAGDLLVRTADQGELRCQAIVLGPAAQRQALQLGPSVSFLFEAEPRSPEQAGLLRLLAGQPSRVLEGDRLAALCERLAAVPAERLSPEQARKLHQEAIAKVASPPPNLDCEPRIARILGWLEDALLEEVSIAALASRAELSESRLRALVRKQLGCSLSQYVRWLAAWKIMGSWHPGITLTDAAHAAGFHDLAHANHAFNDMFGVSPSRVIRPDAVNLINCSPPRAGV